MARQAIQVTNSGVQRCGSHPQCQRNRLNGGRRSEGEAVRRTIRLHHTWAILLITLTAVSVAAQDKPDFSGRWVLGTPQQSAAEIPLALSVHQSVVRTTVRGGPMEPFFRDITIERQFETGTRSEIHLIGVQGGTVPGLRADGTPNGPTA